MNIIAISIGMLVAIAIINLFNVDKVDDRQILYGLYLANLPIYYWIFSLQESSVIFLYQEIFAAIPFFIITGLCFKLKNKLSMALLAPAYFLHAIYDFAHTTLFINSGVPIWWPEFSGVINLILGIYLLIFLQARKNQQAASHVCGHLQ